MKTILKDSVEHALSHQARALEPPSLRAITPRVLAVKGVNLGQGICLLPVPERVAAAAGRAVSEGFNRYTLPSGLPELRQAIADKLERHNKLRVDPAKDLLITCGSTGAFEGICAALLEPGDEVVSFSPYYPYHQNTLARFQAKVRYIDLVPPSFEFSREAFRNAISDKTKFVLINTPSNPSGKIFTREELEFIGGLAAEHNVLVVTDEIYEYMTYDGREHISPATIPSLSDRTFTIGGYSKTFAITGWRIGYLACPVGFSEAIVQLLDSIYICPPAPLQKAVADGIRELGDNFYRSLADGYRAKRELIVRGLESVGIKAFAPQGSYYLIADFSERFPELSSKQFVDKLIDGVGVGTVPSDDFVRDASNAKWVRLCFAVPDEMLTDAVERLKRL